MKPNKRSSKHFLEDIQLSLKRIADYIENYDFQSFKEDSRTVDAVIRNFEIIGKASKNIDNSIKKSHPKVPWEEMYYLRNKVSHEYFGIDYDIIWDIAVNYLPENKKQIDKILQLLKK